MTILDRLLGRAAPTEKAVVTGNGGTGPGVLAYYNDVPLWSASRNPRKLMRQAQALYHEHPWVHAAEHRVSSTAAGVPWHLEDENGEEVTDDSAPELKAIRDLLEKPQANLDPRIKRQTRRAQWQLTLRHEGLCGNGFWYKDQRNGFTGAPAAILYINPARMYPVYDQVGNVRGWKLDADDEGQGGIPIELDEVIQFEYDPPDQGAWGIGIVEANGMKAQLTTLADRHIGNVLAAGGRLTGIIAPKVGEAVSDDNWESLVRGWRNSTEDPNSAKRLQIVKAPIDYTRTTATLQELAIEAVAKMGRDDIFALWGLPLSQQGITTAAGLNSGETKGYDEAVLWQGPVHARLEPFRETIQYQLLDDIADKGGPRTELVIEEPEFDDETPLYERAQKAIDQPLTENERRAILGLDPWPDYDAKGEPLGLAVYRPGTLSLVSQAPDETGKFGTMPEPPPPPPSPFDALPVEELPAKASIRGVIERYEPAIRKAVQAYLASQREQIAARVRKNGDKLARKPKDVSVWWNEALAEAQLEAALSPHALRLAEATVARAKQSLGKADVFADSVAEQVARSVGERIKGITKTTRDEIAGLIAQGFDDGLSPAQVADLIEDATTFSEVRAELIARTESALVYNESAIRSYTEFGIAEVQAIDGDDDAECAARNGHVYPVTEALGITDHPNGTLDWLPVI